MTQALQTQPIDPAFIAAVAREVIDRLRSGRSAERTVGIAERLITVDTLSGYPDKSRIVAAPGAVVTPAAKDEAIIRGITISCGDTTNTSAKTTATVSTTVSHSSDDETDDVLVQQLSRRGLTIPSGMELIWTEAPGSEVCQRCSNGQKAVMVTALMDVDRFAKEFAPECWVLDKQRLNLTAAVNIAARIAQTTAGGSR